MEIWLRRESAGAESRNGRRNSRELRRQGREGLAKPFPEVLGLPDIAFGRRERLVPGALLDAQRIVAPHRRPGDTGRSEVVEGHVLAVRIAFEKLGPGHLRGLKMLAKEDRAVLVYPSASFLAGNRVVFNIKGNKYRVVVAVKYDFFAVYIRFIGTHAEYDKIDAATI
jgi:RelE-like HigB toxin of type II HigAB toxin-antitoxin system